MDARGFLHAREIGPAQSETAEIELNADHLVSAASVIKIVFAVSVAERNPALDAAIGHAARLGVEAIWRE